MRRQRHPRSGQEKTSGLGRNTGVRDLSYKLVVRFQMKSAPRVRGALLYFATFMLGGLSGGRPLLPWS